MINQQTPLRQIWVAAKQGGFHLNYDVESKQWLTDKDQEKLFTLLSRLCQDQAGESVHLEE